MEVRAGRRALLILEWKPVAFKAPRPVPYPDWSATHTSPLRYRPYKRGPYFMTMGVRRMDWNEWIELDNEWMAYHDLKLARLKTRQEKSVRTDPVALDAAFELLECLQDYLPNRYPSMFIRTEVGLDNMITEESFNFVERPLKEDPMSIVAKLLQDDVLILIENTDGQYYLKAGALVLAGFWRLQDKFGLSLAQIHLSGNVPNFKEKLQPSMERFFYKLQPDRPVLRNSVSYHNLFPNAGFHSSG